MIRCKLLKAVCEMLKRFPGIGAMVVSFPFDIVLSFRAVSYMVQDSFNLKLFFVFGFEVLID